MKEYLIYCKLNCNYCDKIIKYMLERNMKFAYVFANNMQEKLDALKIKYNWPTFPIVLEMSDDPNKKTKSI